MRVVHAPFRFLRSYSGRMLLWVSAAVVLRILFFYSFPAFVTNDSWDYVRAAQDIYHHLDFMSPGLRDVRLPGYPTFLALTYPLTGLQSDRLVLVQVMLGLATVGLGYLVGRQLKSRVVAEVLVIFLGLNPVYILIEHTLMTETLFLVSLLAFVVATLPGLRGSYTWMQGIVIGVLIGLSTLIRVNVLPFCLVLVAGVLFGQLNVATKNTSFIAGIKALALSIVMIGSALILTLLPWLVRNTYAFGTPSMVNFGNRNILIFATMYHPLDYSLPTIAAVNQELETTSVDWAWLWKIYQAYGTEGAEDAAREILIEQFSAHPDQYLANVLVGLVGFGGMRDGMAGERTAVQGWVAAHLDNVAKLNADNVALDTNGHNLDFRYVAAGDDNRFNAMFRTASLAYLQIGRPLLYVTTLAAWALFCIAMLVQRRRLRGDLRTTAAVVLGSAYVANVVVHAVTLFDGDRFALPFDWILVLILALMCEVWVGSLRRDTG